MQDRLFIAILRGSVKKGLIQKPEDPFTPAWKAVTKREDKYCFEWTVTVTVCGVWWIPFLLHRNCTACASCVRERSIAIAFLIHSKANFAWKVQDSVCGLQLRKSGTVAPCLNCCLFVLKLLARHSVLLHFALVGGNRLHPA